MDRQGRIAYDLVGGAADPDDFFDALVWRIEGLRAEPAQAAPEPGASKP